MRRTARLLGEVEAVLDRFFAVVKDAGLMAVPSAASPAICDGHAREVHDQIEALGRLASEEVKTLIPVLFILVGDQAMARRFGMDIPERGEETLH
jgi:hypothetical protein